MKKLKIVNPYTLETDDCPIFVQSGDLRGFLGWGIKFRTNSNWNHSMILRRQGILVSQSWTYREIPLRQYMKPYIILKFWKCKDMTPVEKILIESRIDADLKLPWRAKRYDWLGVIGQAVGLRWINIPWLKYCSERVSDRIRVLLPDLKKHPSPEDIDSEFKKSERFEVIGYWLHSEA